MNRTQQTYSKIAQSYFEANRKSGVMQGMLERFVGLLPAGATVLDVGCGPGVDSAEFQSHNLLAISLDLSIAMMQTGRTHYNGHFAQADMRTLPIAKADAIWAAASLLHLPRSAAFDAIQGFVRCLRPDGLLFLAVKQGVGEAWVAESYGHPEPRYFCYWQPEQLDEALSAEFKITHRDAKVSANGTTWLFRFAQAK